MRAVIVSSLSGVLVEPRPQKHFGRTKSQENASSGRKCVVPMSRFDSTEPLDATGGTLRSAEHRLKNTDVYLLSAN